jgi:hypothetical protein
MQSHSHPKRCDLSRPWLLFQDALSLERGEEGGEGSSESRPEGVSLHAEDDTIIGLYCLAQYGIMALDRTLHLLGVVLPTPRAPLYIGEEEGHRAGWLVLHMRDYSF